MVSLTNTHERNSQMKVETVVADSKYGTKDNL